MKISVVIPVYNSERCLEECLDSVAAQTFRDWECLLIDDGSTDSSGAICDAYAASDDRFRVFHGVNAGVSAARNLGIGHTSGSFIAFIDSDDTVDSGYLAELYGAIESSEADLAVCAIRRVRGAEIETAEPEEGVFALQGENSDRFVDLNRKFLLYGPVAKLYRSDIIKDNEIGFPAGVHFGEDLIFNFDYLEHVDTIAATAAAGYNYIMAPSGTLSSSPQSRDFRTNYGQWEIIRSFFERRGINGTEASEFLSNRLWGLAYDTAMSRKMPLNEIKTAFDSRLTDDLRAFRAYTINIPGWLKMAVLLRLHRLIWLIQHRKR